MADGALLNRYWDDNDTLASRSPGLMTSKPPKQPESSGNRDLSHPCSAAASGWDFSPLDGQPATARHHSHHLRLSRSISMP